MSWLDQAPTLLDYAFCNPISLEAPPRLTENGDREAPRRTAGALRQVHAVLHYVVFPKGALSGWMRCPQICELAAPRGDDKEVFR